MSEGDSEKSDDSAADDPLLKKLKAELHPSYSNLNLSTNYTKCLLQR